MAIGKRIKEARLKKSLTQEELAKIIGVTKGAIANYENNTSHPKEPVMYALIDALGVDANFLFQDCVNISPKEKAPLFSSEAMKLAKDYDDLDEHGQRMLRLVANEEKSRYAEQAQSSKVIKIAARDGHFTEIRLTADQIKGLQAYIDQLPEPGDDL